MVTQPTVFVVDDEAAVRKALKQSIESLGARVLCFQSASLCLEALEQERCDLVITDVNMPEMSGVTLLGKIRESHALVPVLVMTGYGSIPLAVKAMQGGAVDFIEKPLDEDVVLPKVRIFVDKAASSDGDALTAAEEKVLQLVAEGRSNKEIAYMLDRSVRTIENHRHRLMKKLKLTSTADMVKFALKR
jgi:two-component system response regulator FixJ